MIAYFFKKGQRKYKDFKSKKTNLLQNQSAPAVHQANKLFLNNLDFNPEIYTTALYLGFVFTLIPTIISINYFRPMNFNPNVISSFSSPLIINFVLPLYIKISWKKSIELYYFPNFSASRCFVGFIYQ